MEKEHNTSDYRTNFSKNSTCNLKCLRRTRFPLLLACARHFFVGASNHNGRRRARSPSLLALRRELRQPIREKNPIVTFIQLLARRSGGRAPSRGRSAHLRSGSGRCQLRLLSREKDPIVALVQLFGRARRK